MDLRLLLSLFLFLSNVWALNSAIPYELLMFYSAYKMDYKTHQAADRTIARSCVHRAALTGDPAIEAAFIQETKDAGVEGICSFDEFVRHVGGADFDRWQKTRAGTTLNPDEATAGAKVRAAALQKRGAPLFYNPEKLHSKIFGLKVPQSKTFRAVSNTAQDSRAFAVGQDFAIVDRAATDVPEFLRIVRSYRLRDQFSYLARAVASAPEASPFRRFLLIENIDIPNAAHSGSLGSFPRYNIDKTIEGAEAAGTKITEDQKDAFKAFFRGYGATDAPAAGGRVAKGHQDVINVARDAFELLSRDVPVHGCAGPPSTPPPASPPPSLKK